MKEAGRCGASDYRLSVTAVPLAPLVETLLATSGDVGKDVASYALHDENLPPLRGAEGSSLVPTGWHDRAIYACPTRNLLCC